MSKGQLSANVSTSGSQMSESTSAVRDSANLPSDGERPYGEMSAMAPCPALIAGLMSARTATPDIDFSSARDDVQSELMCGYAETRTNLSMLAESAAKMDSRISALERVTIGLPATAEGLERAAVALKPPAPAESPSANSFERSSGLEMPSSSQTLLPEGTSDGHIAAPVIAAPVKVPILGSATVLNMGSATVLGIDTFDSSPRLSSAPISRLGSTISCRSRHPCSRRSIS